jgi:hypothetical protein
MHPFNSHETRKALQSASLTLGALSLVLVAYGLSQDGESKTSGLLLPKHVTQDSQWITIDADKVMSGSSIPPDMNVILHIPEDITRITRRVLFGRKGDTTRYWGYCFPRNLHAAALNNRRGFPGTFFLSEKEREHRRRVLIEQRRRTFSIFNNLTEADLNEARPAPRSRIRHQMDVFEGGTSCYVMTEKSIPVGADYDSDGLNNALERGYGSDEKVADTDGDGIIDGFEVFGLGSHPTKRDSDGDGIIDGIEDKNRNGYRPRWTV